MKLLPVLLCGLTLSGAALADTCLNTDKDKYGDGDARHYDYGKCKPAPGSPDNSYNSLNAIGKQMQGMLERNSEDRGAAESQREANLRDIRAFQDQQVTRRSKIKYGASIEFSDIDYSQYQYQNATISADKQEAIRQEIGTAIASGKLLETYSGNTYADWNFWKNSTDPALRWKNCEVATQLVRAYVYGDFIKPEQKNPALGYAIAKAGRYQDCGGTAYWMGRILEDGNSAVPGVDKDKDEIDGGRRVKSAIEGAYNDAILNGYTPAFERMAELYRFGGPERFRGKTYFVLTDFTSYPFWRKSKNDSDEMFLMRVQYSKCLEADPTNLVCARGLVTLYSDQGKDFLDGYTNYSPKQASFYANYAKELEARLVAAGLPVPPAN